MDDGLDEKRTRGITPLKAAGEEKEMQLTHMSKMVQNKLKERKGR